MTEARWPEISGRIMGGKHILPIRVYFEDTDFSGAVYHANYLKFCERGRSDWLRLIGVHHHALFGEGGGAGSAFVVRRMACEFLKAARIDDLLEVHTSCSAASGARLELDQRILKGETTIFEAKVTVAIAGPNGRAGRLPASLLSVLARPKSVAS